MSNQQFNPSNYNYANFQKGNFDADGSTFRHAICLKPTEQKDYLHGYSKNKNAPEAQNKTYAIMGVMKRILPKYYHKMLYIDIYQRHDLTKGWTKENETLLFRIYKTGKVETFVSQEIYSKRIYRHPEQVNVNTAQEFFERTMTALLEGVQTPDLKVSRQKNRENYFRDLLKFGGFDRLSDLESFCKNEVKRGEERGLVNAFWLKYKEGFFAGEASDLNLLSLKFYDFSDAELPQYLERHKSEQSSEAQPAQELQPIIEQPQASHEPSATAQEPQAISEPQASHKPSATTQNATVQDVNKYEPKQRPRAFKPLTPQEREAIKRDQEELRKDAFLRELANSTADIKEKASWYQATLKEKIKPTELEEKLAKYR